MRSNLLVNCCVGDACVSASRTIVASFDNDDSFASRVTYRSICPLPLMVPANSFDSPETSVGAFAADSNVIDG